MRRADTNLKLPQPDLGNVGIDDPHSLTDLALQSFPNPAGDHFTVDFYLPQSGNAILELYDMVGKKIATITNKSYGVGWYTVNVPTDNFENGMYLIKLSSGKMQQVLKVQIEK